jgi:cell division protein FtsZ
MADEVLYSGVRGVTDLMVMPGLINLDFADIRAVMGEMGKAMMGTGEASGENRAIAAAEAAISNPLLDEVSMKGARGVLINITGGMDMTLFEVDEAANRIRDEVDPEANIIFGSTFDQSLDGKIRISVVATGIEAVAQQQRPSQTGGVSLSVIASNPAPQAAAYTAPNLGAVAEDRSIARMEATPAPMPTYQPAPIVAQAPAAAPVMAQAAGAPRQMTAQPMMTTSSIGATALQAQPARPPVVKDEMAHLQRATTIARPVDDRPFIAPQAVEVDRRPQAAHGEPAAGRRGASLFEKMTSRLTGQPLPAQPVQPSRAPAPVQAPRVQARETQRIEQPAAQPMLNLDPSDRIAVPRAEEDLLDIPAFLRRQAN